MECKACGSTEIEEGYKINLCKNCRDSLSNISIPIWVKIFFSFIVVIFLISLFKFPDRISNRLEFERGKKYLNQNEYEKAVSSFEKITEKYSENTDIQSRYFIAQVKNNDLSGAYVTYQKLENKTIYSKDLLKEITEAANELESKIEIIKNLQKNNTDISEEKSGDKK